MPPPLLEGFDPEKAEIGEFLEYIAKARYVQELEKNIMTGRRGRHMKANERGTGPPHTSRRRGGERGP